MTRLVGVHKRDWEWFRTFALEDEAPGLASWAERVVDRMEQLVEKVERAERDGVKLPSETLLAGHAADRVLEAMLKVGSEHALKGVRKEETCSISIGWNGHARVVSMPTYYGVRRRDPTTGERLKQSEMWRFFELSWNEFEDLVGMIRAQANVLADRVTAWEEVLPLRKQFPDSATPREAMDRAGLDPYQFARRIEDTGS
jgi:hypothetical protein